LALPVTTEFAVVGTSHSALVSLANYCQISL